MATPDPVPQRSMRHRFARLMRVAAALSIIIAALAVVLVARGGPGSQITLLIATALGIGLAVLLAAALMSLFSSSHRGGADADAGAPPFESDKT